MDPTRAPPAHLLRQVLEAQEPQLAAQPAGVGGRVPPLRQEPGVGQLLQAGRALLPGLLGRLGQVCASHGGEGECARRGGCVVGGRRVPGTWVGAQRWAAAAAAAAVAVVRGVSRLWLRLGLLHCPCTHMSTHTHIQTHSHMRMRTYAYAYSCVCILYTHTHTHTRAHRHTHAQTHSHTKARTCPQLAGDHVRRIVAEELHRRQHKEAAVAVVVLHSGITRKQECLMKATLTST